MSIVVTREDLNPCTIKLSVTCKDETVKQGFDRAYKQASKNIRVPGFRPGTAPKHLVERSVPRQTIYELAADEIVRINWKKALEQLAIEPFQNPVVDLKELREGNELNEKGEPLGDAVCEFDLKVPLKPVVELGDYKSLKAEKPPIDVSDEEVEAQIDAMRNRRGKREAVTDRGLEIGDIAVVNIRPEGQEGEGRTFMAIAGQTFKELDETLVGMQAEELKSLDLKFPKDFQDPELAGKSMHCTVTLRSVSANKLPELDDSFAQGFQAESVGELRNRTKEALLRIKQQQVQSYVNEQLLDDLLSKSTIHVPDTMWEQVATQRLNDIARDQQEKKESIEDYVKAHGMSVEQFVAAVQSEARMFVQRAQAIQEIFVKEELKIDNEALNQEVIQISMEVGLSPEEVVAAYQKNNALNEIYHRTIHRKVLNLLNSFATISEVSVDGIAPEKPAAKAKSAKKDAADADAPKKPKAKK